MAYGILKESRKCHHATYVLNEVIKELFCNEISSIHMIVDNSNIPSQRVIESINCIKQINSCDEGNYKTYILNFSKK